jgi:hypothetical protein
MSNNIQVRDSLGSIITMKTIERDGIHTPYQIVGSVDKKFRDSFPGAAVDTAKWDASLGTGGSITVAGGVLTLGSGTTINDGPSVLSKETFTIPFRLSFNLSLSQRITNQAFLVEVVSVNESTGLPDGLHSAAWVFDGTAVAQAKYRVQNSGIAPLDSAASTITTTAAPGGVYELEPFADECWFHTNTLDSATARAVSYRRHQQIPDPNGIYKIRLRWLNGGTAPASNTNAMLQFVAMQDYQELTAEITAGRGQSSAGQAIAAAVVSMPTVAANVTAQNNVFYNDSVTNLGISGALTGTTRDIGIAASAVHRYSKFNAMALADQPGTMRIEISNDNVTWRRATVDTAVAANTPVLLSIPIMTRYHRAVYTNGATAQTVFMLNTSFTAA